MEVGEKVKLEVIRIRGDGKGVAFGPDGTTVLIDGVTDGDKYIESRITKILEFTALAQKTNRLKNEQVRQDLVDSPYELDDEDDDEEYDD